MSLNEVKELDNAMNAYLALINKSIENGPMDKDVIFRIKEHQTLLNSIANQFHNLDQYQDHIVKSKVSVAQMIKQFEQHSVEHHEKLQIRLTAKER
jgi:hypothetical protein